MAHPHKQEASETSRSKMRAITGRGGGGTSFVGSSSFKRAGADGEQKSYLGHEKVFASPKAAGGKVKRRADRFARGGKVGKAKGGSVAYDTHDLYSPEFREDRSVSSQSLPDVPEQQQTPRDRNARGGKVKMQGGGTAERNRRFLEGPEGRKAMQGQTMDPMTREQAAKQGDAILDGTAVPNESPPPVMNEKRGGRIKRAQGGRTLMPYGNENRRRVSKPGKKAGNVNIAINMPPHIPHPGGGMPPPMPPPGGAGGPPGLPPGGGAPPPAIPPALMGGAGGASGGPPGAGGAPGGPGGVNPAAMQALAGIAGGAGPMGAGLPGRGPFAKGGAVKSTGLASNLAHWREYSTRNVRGNSAQNRGATGESEELPLRTPDHVGGSSDDAVAKRRGGRGEGGKYAAGGRTKYPKDPLNLPGPGSKEGQDWYRKLSAEPHDDADVSRQEAKDMMSGSFRKGGRSKRAAGGPLVDRRAVDRRVVGPYTGPPEVTDRARAAGPAVGPYRGPPEVDTGSDSGGYAEQGQNRGGRVRRARGGKIPVPMTGGSETGVGRKRMAELQPKWR